MPAWTEYTVTVPNNRIEFEVVVPAVGVTATDVLSVRYAIADDMEENTPELLDATALYAVAGTDQFTMYLAFSTPQSGPINLLYRT